MISLNDCVDDVIYDECIDDNIDKILRDEVNCTVPWLKNKKNICKTLFTQSRVFKLFQENIKNQANICPQSCTQNIISFGPVNQDKIREASIQGRVVFHLPRTLRVNQERIRTTFKDILPDLMSPLGFDLILKTLIQSLVFRDNCVNRILHVHHYNFKNCQETIIIKNSSPNQVCLVLNIIFHT